MTTPSVPDDVMKVARTAFSNASWQGKSGLEAAVAAAILADRASQEAEIKALRAALDRKVIAKEISQRNREANLCSDCPPIGYPTHRTRCLPCPRHSVPRAARDFLQKNGGVDG